MLGGGEVKQEQCEDDTRNKMWGSSITISLTRVSYQYSMSLSLMISPSQTAFGRFWGLVAFRNSWVCSRSIVPFGLWSWCCVAGR